MTYDDYRLAAIYDADNPGGVDHDYFRALADRPGVTRVVDLGCGTGSLTVTLTGPGRRVIGIDPAAAMLAYAAAARAVAPSSGGSAHRSASTPIPLTSSS